MPDEMDLSFLDSPEILQVLFPLVYASFQIPDFLRSRSAAIPVHTVEVGDGVNINCGFWVSGKENPTILYFHGNGETVYTHEWVAPHYNWRGINLFVADYRGYGSSSGKPTVSNMVSDAHIIFQAFRGKIAKDGFTNSLFVMGRSLGSVPAIEVALHYQDKLRGLIVESGTASNFRRLRNNALGTTETGIIAEDNPFLNGVKVRQIHKPTLIMHGEYDEIIPVEEGNKLYRNSGSGDKTIVIIPGAGHNDIMMNQELYFGTLEKFVMTHK